MSNINHLLLLGEIIFKNIDDSVQNGSYANATALLNTPQPDEWQIPLISEATGQTYFHNDIELIEAICDRVFHFYNYEIITTIVTPTKSGLAITISTRVHYGWDRLKMSKDGIATEFVTNPKMLPLASPKCATMSFKNGIKKAGNLFGKSLNRNLENAPIEDVPDVFTEKSDFEIALDKCQTMADLTPLKVNLSPAQQKLYMNKLKELSAKK